MILKPSRRIGASIGLGIGVTTPTKASSSSLTNEKSIWMPNVACTFAHRLKDNVGQWSITASASAPFCLLSMEMEPKYCILYQRSIQSLWQQMKISFERKKSLKLSSCLCHLWEKIIFNGGWIVLETLDWLISKLINYFLKNWSKFSSVSLMCSTGVSCCIVVHV